ncbi:dATP/dGTP pyrophosphohydrolase domain-containing protein [Phytohabitans houttuyneae]|uniref:dATP/dGTP pyrophosphohydrolase domain-containing protein n=1 Tax=Phytohabitans houttuyneae TaxID=1076126 RepID=UPI0031E6C870
MIELPEGQQSNLGPFFNESADDLNVSIRKLVAGLDTLGIRPYADNAPSWSWVMFCLDRIETLRREVARVRADAASAPASVDASFVARKREFSARTFGPQALAGVIDHIRKELVEVEADPTDLGEWVDVIMLGLDGAWRAGHEPQEILDAIVAKQARCEARTWPDWRTTDPGQAIEHDRGVAPAESVVGAPTAISALRAGGKEDVPLAVVPAYRLAATQAVLAERERELLELKGACSTEACRLHYAHAGPCAPRVESATTAVGAVGGGPPNADLGSVEKGNAE